MMLIYFAGHGLLKVIFQADDSYTMRSHEICLFRVKAFHLGKVYRWMGFSLFLNF